MGLWNDSTATGIFPGYWGRTALTTTDTLDNTHHYVECDASGGAWTLTLPSAAAATIGAGRYYIIKLTDATNTLTIDGDASETIDGVTTATMTVANEILVLISDGTNWQVLQRTVPNSDLKVMPQRSKFAFKDGDEIYIDGGCYHLQSVNQQFVYWSSQITFVLQSGGSNAASDDYGADGWHYIYIDDSAVATQASPLLDADCFLNDTTAPTWSNAKRGWYNGEDLCIFAVFETGGALLEFLHDGGGYVIHADGLAGGQTAIGDFDFTTIDVDTTWDDVYLPIPGFSTKAECTFEGKRVATGTTGAIAYWRTNGQTAATGHYLFNTASAAGGQANELYHSAATVATDATQIIEVKYSRDEDETLSVWVNGWYFPTGM